MKDQALKDISSFKDLASSVLASSPLWNLPARRIKPQQLASFKQRLKFEGYKDIDFLFHKIMLSLNQAKRSGELKYAPILTYTEPSHKVLTSTDLINGFDQMSRPSPAAILREPHRPRCSSIRTCIRLPTPNCPATQPAF